MRATLLIGTVVSLLGAGLVAAPAFAGTATDLYVNNTVSGCTDAGAGTAAVPFCTVQAAAAVVLPGQTVHVLGDSVYGIGDYEGEIDVTRSGTPGAPITFTTGDGIQIANIDPSAQHTFVLNGVHDVVISGFGLFSNGDAVVIDNSSRVTVDRNFIDSKGGEAISGSDVVLSGQTSDVTISRNRVAAARPDAIVVGPGGTDDTITTNVAEGSYAGSGISVTGATGTVITSNTVDDNCASGIAVSGGATGTRIENNVADHDLTGTSCGTSAPAAEISVAADSTAQTVENYNIAYNSQPADPLYNWAGTGYTSLAGFQAASGQGAQDSTQNPHVGVNNSIQDGKPAEGSTVIDSADATAPGELSTDVAGNLRTDDLLVANTGTGNGYYDRGAYEFQDPFVLSKLTITPLKGVAPVPVSVTPQVTNPWSTPVSYTVDFGDGSTPVVTAPSSTPPTVNHTYTSVGWYTINVTATLPNGRVVTGQWLEIKTVNQIQVNPPGPLVPALSVEQHDPANPETVYADDEASTDPWQITTSTYDFGDGTPTVTADGVLSHQYAAPGTYTVTVTVQDYAGRTATIAKTITLGAAYVPLSPARLLDTRTGTGAPQVPLGPGTTLNLPVAGVGGVPATGVRAVVLNVTVTNPTVGGYLTVFPGQSDRPLASNLNFTAGQTVPNLVTVPVGPDGSVNFYNFHGNVDVVADVEGYYSYAPNPVSAGAVNGAGFLVSQSPTRLLDTRTTQNPAGPNQTLAMPMSTLTDAQVWYGQADALVLNVTVTDPTASSYLTVYTGAHRPVASNLNFAAGQTTSNAVIVPVDSIDDPIDFYNFQGTAQVVVDIEGFFASQNAYDENGGMDESFVPIAPTRLLDTRNGSGAIQPGTARALTVAGTVGAAGDPVVMNVTVTDATADSYLTMYPDGSARPLASDLNFAAGQTVPNLVTVPIGADGKVDFYNFRGSVDVVADAFGYFVPTLV